MAIPDLGDVIAHFNGKPPRPITRADLPVGTIVKVTECGPDVRTYVGKVVGYDLWRSKYEIGLRYSSWEEEHRYLDGGSWAFPSWVEPVETSND